MQETTTVYVFDHASGFDWNIDRTIVEAERDDYARAGWIAEDDGIYRITVPIVLAPGVNNAAITEYLEGEDWINLGGVALWNPSRDEVQQEA